jgi:hypothetical protein
MEYMEPLTLVLMTVVSTVQVEISCFWDCIDWNTELHFEQD